ncbi:MAG: hypothetical protein LBI48_09305 [Burkholderiaceae bacterium]|nr:hypothetical protein [Burkholderiaceae bacterium]
MTRLKAVTIVPQPADFARIAQLIAASEWGDGVVDQLACYLAQTQPGLRGFTGRLTGYS